jgi:hypothetical protein
MQYSQYSREVGKLTGQSGRIAMSNNFYRMQYTHKWLVSGLDFAILPEELIQISVFGSTSAWKDYQKSIYAKIYGSAGQYYPQYGTLSQILAENRGKEIANIQRAITQGLLQGKGYRDTARSIREVIGQFIRDKDGNIHTSGAMANSLRIIRTESTRIMNDAALANTEYARSEGVDVVRIWDATLDGKTRKSHRKLDDKPEDSNGKWLNGTVSGPGRGPTAAFNANCRCTTFESVNGSRPTLRRGINQQKYDQVLRQELEQKKRARAEKNQKLTKTDVKEAEATAKRESVEVFSYKNYEQWAKDNGLKQNKAGEYVYKN